MKSYAFVCVAGTFDGLHKGHQTLIKKAFAVSDRVLIGLTTDAYVAAYKKGTSSPYQSRLAALVSWVDRQGWTPRCQIIPLDDSYGPAISDPDLEALIVSEETKAGGDLVNAKRREKKMPLLEIIVVPIVNAEDHEPISSTRVRTGVITGDGSLILPEYLREELAQPMGVVRAGSGIQASFEDHRGNVSITIGDRTTKTALDAGLTPSLMIIDNKVHRSSYPDLLPILVQRNFSKTHVSSGPGFISKEAREKIHNACRVLGTKPLVLDVNGEDDLLTLPVLVEAPVGTVVYYGQPAMPGWACGPIVEGIVEVIVTADIQQKARRMLDTFTVS